MAFDDLDDFINDKSNFFNLLDGHEAIVKLLGAQKITTSYNGTPVNSIRYTFEIKGKEMFWDRSSRDLAVLMKEFNKGDVLRIKRFGQKNKTRYEIEKIS